MSLGIWVAIEIMSIGIWVAIEIMSLGIWVARRDHVTRHLGGS